MQFTYLHSGFQGALNRPTETDRNPFQHSNCSNSDTMCKCVSFLCSCEKIKHALVSLILSLATGDGKKQRCCTILTILKSRSVSRKHLYIMWTLFMLKWKRSVQFVMVWKINWDIITRMKKRNLPQTSGLGESLVHSKTHKGTEIRDKA